MDIDAPTPLLGGLSPAAFMRRYWQKKPFLVRQAWAGVQPPLPRAELFQLAERDDVESRLVRQQGSGWTLRRGPLQRRALPPLKAPGWTLLVQGLDLHVEAAREMLSRFRFVPEARLDDLMVSFATTGGGVGPHLDAYDVFLLQVQGRRRWRIGPAKQPQWVEGVPLKLLANFEPDEEWVLEPGDMLYLPPLWGHDGIAESDDCMTCSVGFRTPARAQLAHEVLQRVVDAIDTDEPGPLYRDPRQTATETPGAIPAELAAFASDAVHRLLADPAALACALGEALTEPKPLVWFDEGQGDVAGGVRLDRRTRMMYDMQHVFINGESFRAAGRDATLMRRLADGRRLSSAEVARLSADARALLQDWLDAGWVRSDDDARA
jgi:50S ribosomal protein L16 3-hydroxylase